MTYRQWRALVRAFDGRCAYCGERPSRLTQDHMIPLSKGGPNTAVNIVPSCQPCNSRKGARTISEWATSEQVDRVLSRALAAVDG